MHGRKHLPWQHPTDPYRVWVSEIMLQQTQVATVIPYFERFMIDFPNVQSLASAPLDAVLGHWSGLGYYARARNLHKAALQIYAQHSGKLPTTAEALTALPGIGQSTAHAILSLAYQQPTAICDGNVRRVLARWLAIDLPMDKPSGQALAWQAAEQLQSHTRPAAYTQAIMDIGATLCTRSKPNCMQCPLHNDCAALLSANSVTDWPKRSQKPPKPSKSCTMWLLMDGHNLWLEAPQREEGLWGGLYQLPQTLPLSDSLTFTSLRPTKHIFTHFTLHIQPNILLLQSEQLDHLPRNGLWYNPKQNKLPPRPAIVDKLYRTWLQHKELTDDTSRLLR